MRVASLLSKSCRAHPTKLLAHLRHSQVNPLNIDGSRLLPRLSSYLAMESPSRMPDDDDVYFHIIECAEHMGRYRAGGYHPVSIGDRFNGRYRVLDKLGHGSYSTVWLARDERLQRLVALKVCTADASPRESEILSLLKKSCLSASNDSVMSGRDLIISLLDTFRVEGPHGTHICQVSELARCNLARARNSSHNAPINLHVARAMVAQFVLAVAYMHHNGFVHGDLHVGNILLKHSRRLDHLSDEELCEEFGEPEYEAVRTFHDKPIPKNVPTTATLPLFFPTRTSELSLLDAHILLSDLGESFRPSEEQRLECRTPVHCRPPEDRFEPSQPRSFPSDVWTLACSIWGIIGLLPLFESIMPCEDNTTRMQVELLGKLPPEWWARWKRRSKYFTDDGQLLEDRSVWAWDSYFENDTKEFRRRLGMEQISSQEKEALIAMLQPMLMYKPETRCSVGDVLKSKWMTDWAMPEYEKLRREPLLLL